MRVKYILYAIQINLDLNIFGVHMFWPEIVIAFKRLVPPPNSCDWLTRQSNVLKASQTRIKPTHKLISPV